MVCERERKKRGEKGRMERRREKDVRFFFFKKRQAPLSTPSAKSRACSLSPSLPLYLPLLPSPPPSINPILSLPFCTFLFFHSFFSQPLFCIIPPSLPLFPSLPSSLCPPFLSALFYSVTSFFSQLPPLFYIPTPSLPPSASIFLSIPCLRCVPHRSSSAPPPPHPTPSRRPNFLSLLLVVTLPRLTPEALWQFFTATAAESGRQALQAGRC